MTENEKLPLAIAARQVAVSTQKHISLVARGVTDLKLNNDTLYHQARLVFYGRKKTNKRNTVDNPPLASAFNVFQKLVAQGYGKAYFPLSILYREMQDADEGHSHAPLAQLAFEWCIANQANQDAELWCDLGSMYLEGLGVGQQNVSQGFYWFSKAAELGYARGQFNLGTMYHNGLGVDKNDVLAAYWFRKAAEQKSEYGQCWLGRMYELGMGVLQDYKEALKWYQLAADQGEAYAQTKLGVMYNDGEVVPKDYVEAVKWYRLAAEQNYARAQLFLGDMYLNGRGVQGDYGEAAKWYQLAADQGDVDAQAELDLMYAEVIMRLPRLIRAGREDAANWCQYLADQGDTRAKESLGKLVDWKK